MWYFNSVIEEGDLFNKWCRQKWIFMGKNKSIDSYFTYGKKMKCSTGIS